MIISHLQGWQMRLFWNLHEIVKDVQLNIQIQDFPICDVVRSHTRGIQRYSEPAGLESILDKKVLIVAGEARSYNNETEKLIEAFASHHNCAIYTNHLSNLHTKHCIEGNLFLSGYHTDKKWNDIKPDIIISIGGQTGDYPLYNWLSKTQLETEHWEISTDGKVVDTYDKLTRVYQMSPKEFFNKLTRFKMRSISISIRGRNWKANMFGILNSHCQMHI